MAKVLIVDDKENNLLALRQVLKGLDVEIVQALSADDALRATLNHEFALAILDVQMPAMDGYELAALLRSDQHTRHMPIIFLSAVYLEAPHVFKGYSSGAVDFITKPFDPVILLSKVRVFLELDARRVETEHQKASLEKLVKRLEQQIEARKKAEQELLKSRMLEALGTLAGGIAHDFNNMLAVVLAQIELARFKNGDRDIEQTLGEAEKAILKATELTAKFITFSGGGSPLKQRIAVEEFIRRSVESALIGSDIQAEFSFAKDLWDIHADRKQMDQVVFVMVANAREAMHQSGTINIAAVNWVAGPEEEIEALATAQGPWVQITITDQGPGIPAENLAKIFDPYYSTKQRGNEKGMGLGLTIAHSIIKKHDGSIQAQSGRESGASFHIFLPALAKT